MRFVVTDLGDSQERSVIVLTVLTFFDISERRRDIHFHKAVVIRMCAIAHMHICQYVDMNSH